MNDLSLALTDREKQLVDLYKQGKSTYEISLSLGVAKTTVALYFSRLLSKFGVHSRQSVISILNGEEKPPIEVPPTPTSLWRSQNIAIQKLLDKGYSINKISKTLGLTHSRVYQRVNRTLKKTAQ